MGCVQVLTVAGLLLAGPAAQERRPAFVVAVDAQGKPAAGAAITCFASPTLTETGDEVDAVEGVTDDRGRFVAKLLTHRTYSAFAILPGVADDFLASEMREDVAAGTDIELPLVVERHAQRLVLEGDAAWHPHVGQLTLAVTPVARNQLLLSVQGEQVPRLPRLGCAVVRDAQGQPLWSQQLAGLQPERMVVRLPPPHTLRVRVRAPEGTPIANAAVWQAIEQCDVSRVDVQGAVCASVGSQPRPAWRLLGSTGDDGTLEVRIAVAAGDGIVHENLVLRAHAAGRAYAVGGANGGIAFDGPRQFPMPSDGSLSISLVPARRLRVHPPGAFDVVLIGRAEGRPILRAREEEPVCVTTDAAGNAELPVEDAPDMVRVAKLQRADERPIWSIVANVDGDSWVGSSPPEVHVLVTDASGHPARGRQIVLVPWLMRGPGFDLPMLLDQAGRTTLRINLGTWFLWCCDGSDAAWCVVDFAKPPKDVALQLQPIPRATVRILDAEGKPRVGLLVLPSANFSWDSQSASVENRCLILRQISLLAPPGETLRSTDGEGCLQYLMLPLPQAKLSFAATTMGGDISSPTVLVVGQHIDVVVK